MTPTHKIPTLSGGRGPQTQPLHQNYLTLLAMQCVGHNVQIQDYVLILLPIQTKINVCFNPIIYPLESHQLAGRLVCLAHAFLMCPVRSIWDAKGSKGAFNSVQFYQNIYRVNITDLCNYATIPRGHNWISLDSHSINLVLCCIWSQFVCGMPLTR